MNAFWRALVELQHRNVFVVALCLDDLALRGVAIEGRNDWSRGGRSIYFRDPEGHLLELATPGLWSVYYALRHYICRSSKDAIARRTDEIRWDGRGGDIGLWTFRSNPSRE